MEREAEIDTGYDHLGVSPWAGDVAYAFPIGKVGLGFYAQFSTID
jgi:hypothetical protein